MDPAILYSQLPCKSCTCWSAVIQVFDLSFDECCRLIEALLKLTILRMDLLHYDEFIVILFKHLYLCKDFCKVCFKDLFIPKVMNVYRCSTIVHDYRRF